MYYDVVDALDALFDPRSDWASTQKYSTPSFPPSNVICEDDGTMRFEFALAGYSKKDLVVDFEENKLLLSTAEGYESPKTTEKYLSNNIKKPSFKYSYYIPEIKFKFSEAKAEFKDGILTIKVPPVEKKEYKKVNID